MELGVRAECGGEGGGGRGRGGRGEKRERREGRGREVKYRDEYKGKVCVQLTGRNQMGREELPGSNDRSCSPWCSW